MGTLNTSGGRPRKGNTPYPENGRVYWVRATEEMECILEQARAADQAITSSGEHIRRLIADGARWRGINGMASYVEMYGVICARCIHYNAEEKWCDAYACDVDNPKLHIECDKYKRSALVLREK